MEKVIQTKEQPAKNYCWHCKALLEYQNGMVAIHPRFSKLIGTLDKDAASFYDCFDSFKLSLMFSH
jgi:hypothetical protein